MATGGETQSDGSGLIVALALIGGLVGFSANGGGGALLGAIAGLGIAAGLIKALQSVGMIIVGIIGLLGAYIAIKVGWDRLTRASTASTEAAPTPPAPPPVSPAPMPETNPPPAPEPPPIAEAAPQTPTPTRPTEPPPVQTSQPIQPASPPIPIPRARADGLQPSTALVRNKRPVWFENRCDYHLRVFFRWKDENDLVRVYKWDIPRGYHGYLRNSIGNAIVASDRYFSYYADSDEVDNIWSGELRVRSGPLTLPMRNAYFDLPDGSRYAYFLCG